MKQFITRTYGATKLLLKANAPTLLVVGGVAAMGASVIVASKKTLTVEDRLSPHADELDSIKSARDAGAPSYGDNEALKDTTKLYAKVGKDLTVHYAVPVVLFASGAAMVFGGHHIMLKRNATLALAFTTVSKAFEAYRANATAAMGPEFDTAMVNGYKMKTVRNDLGEMVESYPTRDWDAPENDPYNRVFDSESSSLWQNDLGVNKLTIHNQQRMANILLNTRGYLYLSEVYESLGLAENDISRVVGWKVRQLPDGSRDIPYVDFGLDKRHPQDWVYNEYNAIYLDFNCQGLIVGGRVQKALEQA